jgi:hypothetical protein
VTRTAALGVFLSLFFVMGAPTATSGAEWFVASGGHGDGSRASPFGRVQQGLDAAGPGDLVSLLPGTFVESVHTSKAGEPRAPITLRALSGRGTVIITSRGRVASIQNPYNVLDGLILDGQYGADDIVRVATAASGFILRNTEVRRTSSDAIDLGSPADVLIENCLIHHALNAAGGRTDSHGIVASAVRRLVVRNTEIHTFSGDGIQLDPDRAAPGWSDVLIERCRIWLGPLPAAENGFPAGTTPGENAVDTKSNRRYGRAQLTVRDTEAWGFHHGLIQNMAAFNLKESTDVLLDRITVHDSEIAFRLRGPGPNDGVRVTVANAVIYDSEVAFRYEDNIERLRIWNCTIGSSVPQPFVAASSNRAGLDVQNLLVLGRALPPEASAGSNRAVAATSFIDAGVGHDYRLRPTSPAVDAGTTLPAVTRDRAGTLRPQGAAYDVGAYERPRGPEPRRPPRSRVTSAASAPGPGT